MADKKGVFITLEGIDGCGKSTQTKLLADALTERGHQVIATKEPGGTETGKVIRQIILGDEKLELAKETECLLMLADRAQHVYEVIRPALNEGKIVISDRHKDSTIAYQLYGAGLPPNLTATVSAYISAMGMRHPKDFIDPHLTFLLDIPVEESIKRTGLRVKDKIEKRGVDFYERVRKGYLEIAQYQSERVVLLNGMQPLETLQEIILIAALDHIERTMR